MAYAYFLPQAGGIEKILGADRGFGAMANEGLEALPKLLGVHAPWPPIAPPCFIL